MRNGERFFDIIQLISNKILLIKKQLFVYTLIYYVICNR